MRKAATMFQDSLRPEDCILGPISYHMKKALLQRPWSVELDAMGQAFGTVEMKLQMQYKQMVPIVCKDADST